MNINISGLIKIVIGLALAVTLFYGYKYYNTTNAPDNIISTSLQGIQQQNKVLVFTAAYVSVSTSKQQRYFMTAEKTFIIPGVVRYEVDFSKLEASNLEWDGKTEELRVTLPPLELSGPEFDLERIKEYSSGGIVMRMTDVESQLDHMNRRKAKLDMLTQARAPQMLAFAKDAARIAVEHNFSVPLQAAGIKAKVLVRFPGEEFKGGGLQFMDRSRDVKQVYNDKTVGMN